MPTSSAVLEAMVKVTGGQQAATELNALGGAVQKTAGQMDASGKAMEAIGNKTATTGQKFNNLGNSLKSNAGSITAVTGSAWGLFNAFDDMEKKVLSTNKAQTMAERSALMLSKAQQKLAAIASKQGKGSQEYATQLEVVRLAQDKATQSGEKAKIMAGDLQESYVQLAMTAGPQFAVLGGSIAQMVANFSRVGPAAKAGAAGLEVASTGMKSAGMASKLLHLALGPVGLVLLAIGTLFTLYATNAWGFADAVNGVAKAIMDGVGQIWTTISKVGGQITSFLGALMKDIVSGNIPAALTRIKDLISGIFTEWVKPVFDKIYNFLLDKFSAIATAIGLPIDSAKKLLQGFVDFIFSIFGTLGEGITKAFDALASGNIIGAILAIQDMFNKLVLTVLEAMTVLFTESIPALLVALGGIIMKEVSKWPKFIMDAFATLADWFATEGPKWLAGIGAAIAAEAPKWIATIMEAFGKLGEAMKIQAMEIPKNISASISFWNWDDAWQSLKDAFWSTIIWIKDTGNAMPGQILAAIMSVDWAGAWQALQNAFNSTVEWIKTNFTWENLAAAFQITRDIFAPVRTAFDTMWNAIKGLFTWENLAAAFQITRDIFAPVRTAFDTVWSAIKSIFTWENFASAFKVRLDLFTNLQTAFGNIWNSITAIFTWANFTKNFVVPTNIFSGMLTGFQNVVNLISTAAGGLKLDEKFKIPPNIFSGAADLFSKNVIDPISKALDEWDVQQKFADIGKQIVDAFNGAGVALGDFFANLGKVPEATAEVEKGVFGATVAIGNVGPASNTASKGLAGVDLELGKVTSSGAKTQDALDSINMRRLGAEANLVANVMKEFAKNSLAGLQDLANEGPRLMTKVTDAVKKYGEELLGSLDETLVGLKAQRLFWSSIPADVKNYINALQQATLANIDVKQALTDTNYAQYKYNEGLIEGKTAVKTFVDENVKARGVYDATRSALISTADSLGEFGNAAVQSNDQIKQWIGAVQGAPDALQNLASALASGTQEAQKFLTFAGEENELFGKWIIDTDKVPSEIRGLMTKSTNAFLVGQAELQRTMEQLGPLISATISQAVLSADTSSLIEFGRNAATVLRSGFSELGAAGNELASALEAMSAQAAASGGKLDASMVGPIQRVVTAMQNATDPTAALMNQLASIVTPANNAGAAMLTMKGGLEALSAAGKSVTSSLAELPKVIITAADGSGKAVAEFANLNGQLIPIPGAANSAASGLGAITGAANPLNAAIQLAAKSLQQFNDYLANTANMPKLQIDTSAVVTNLNSVITAINGIKQTTVPIIKVDTGAVATNLNSVKAAIDAVKQTKVPIVTVTTAVGTGLVKKLQAAITAIKQNKAVLISVNTSAATSAVNKLRSLVNALPNIKRTITYTYRIVGSRPNPPNLNRTITYRYQTVGSRPTSLAPPTLNSASPTIMPMTTGGSITSGGGGFTGGKGGGGQPTNFQGDVYLDTYRVGRVMGKAIAENNV